MRKIIEFILSIICTFVYIFGYLCKFFYLLFKYICIGIFKAYKEAIKESYDILDKGWE